MKDKKKQEVIEAMKEAEASAPPALSTLEEDVFAP